MTARVNLPDLRDREAQVKCQAGCPVSTDAGRHVQLVAEGRHEEAYLVARSPDPFASVCGRVCAAPCEDACRRGVIDGPGVFAGGDVQPILAAIRRLSNADL
jgi:NADPH-dependent glutamate synthase beta subunit-like oxidoreductase